MPIKQNLAGRYTRFAKGSKRRKSVQNFAASANFKLIERRVLMNLQEMLSKVTPEQLQQGMKQLGLTPEQMKQVSNMVGNNKSTDNKR